MLYALVFVFVTQNSMGATSCDPGQYAVEMQTPILGGGGGFITQTVCLNCPEGYYCRGGLYNKAKCPSGFPNSDEKSTDEEDCFANVYKNLNYSSSTSSTLYAHPHHHNSTTPTNACNAGGPSMMCGKTTYAFVNGHLPASPSRDGYTFKGWYTDRNGTGTRVYAATSSGSMNGATWLSGDTTLYAKWEANTYTIRFYANGGSGSMNSQSVTYGTTGNKLKSNVFTKDGYTFAGWCKGGTSCATPTYQNGATVNNLTADMALYAMWTPKKYTVTYKCGSGATGTAPSVGTATYDSNFEPAASSGTCSKVGYVFVGWSTTDNAGNETIHHTGVVFKWNYTANKTFTARWLLENYEIQYLYPRDNGRSCINDGQRYDGWCGMYTRQHPLLPNSYTVNSATISLPTESDVDAWFVVNDGSGLDSIPYSFGGWYEMTNESSLPCTASGSSSMCSGTPVTQFTPDTNNLANRVFMSKWTPKSYTITLDPNGGSGGTSVLYTKYGVGVYLDAYLNHRMSTSANPITPPTTKPQISVTYKDDDGTTVLSQVPYDLTFDGYWYGDKIRIINSDGYITAEGLHYGQTAGNDVWPAVWTCASVTLPTPANKPGYNFMGWYDGTGANATKIGDADSTTLCLSENQTMYAKWEVIRYTITYDTNGGTLAAGINNPANYTVGSQPIALLNDSDITKTGHTFDGWCVYDAEQTPAVTTCDDSVLMNELAAGTTGDKWAYAKWTPKQYTVIYKCDGVQTQTDTVTYGTNYTVLDNTTVCAKAGYMPSPFECSPTIPNGAWNIDGDVTCSATRTGNTISLKWANGGHGTVPTTTLATCTYGSKFNMPDALTETGWIFKNWGVNNKTFNGNQQNVDCNYENLGVYSGSATITANWTPETYTITYHNTTGASFTTANPSEYTIEDTVALTNPTKTGYNFAGWCSGSTTCNNPSLNVSFSSETGNKEYYAKWTPKQYTVTYECDGVQTQTNTVTYGTNYTVLDNTTVCAKAGYTPSPFECSPTIPNGAWDIDNNVTCSATRTGNTISLKWANGGHGTAPTTLATCTYGSTFDMPAALTETGWIFKNWEVNNKTFNGNQQNVDCNYENLGVYSGSATITANWTPETYTITYHNTTGASFTTANPSEYTIEDTVALTNPTKTGYNFAGWCSGSTTCNNPLLSVSFSSETGNKEYYASWTPISYNITYYNITGASFVTPNPSTYTIEDRIALVNPTKTGYTFGGWCDNEALTQNCLTEKTIAQGSTGNKAYYAKWTPIEYTITYNTNGGAMTGDGIVIVASNSKYTQSYTVESESITLTKPNHGDGYTFDGWYTNSNFTGAKVTQIEPGTENNQNHENISLYAKWKLTEYDITYYDVLVYDDVSNITTQQRSSAPDGYPSTYTIETSFNFTELSEPEDPKGLGWVFDGWCDNEALTQNCSTEKTIAQGSTGDKAYYAKWTPKKGYVNFICNPELTVEKSGQVGSFISVATAAECGLDENTGWSCSGHPKFKDNYTQIQVPDGTSTCRTGYNIRYEGDGIDNNVITSTNVRLVPDTYTSDLEVVFPSKRFMNNNKVRTGYSFTGWFYNENFTNATTGIARGSSGNKIVYAKWTPNVYRVTYDCDSTDANSKTPSSGTIKYDTNFTTALNTCKKTGYTFNGWKVSGTGDSKEAGKTFKWQYDEDKTFIAKWTPITYQVTFDSNGATGSMSSQSFTYDEEKTLTANGYSRTGYTFAGWCDAWNSETNVCAENANNYSDEQVVSNLTTETTIKLYAQWTPIEYTITYNGIDGASLAENNPSTYTIESATITLNNPTKIGYTFGGWCDNEALTQNCSTEKTIAQGSTGDKVFWAKWAPIEYTIKYNVSKNGNTWQYESGLSPVKYTVDGTNAALPTSITTTRTGYVFAGWCLQDSYDIPNCAPVNMAYLVANVRADVQLYAKWTPVDYTIKYYVYYFDNVGWQDKDLTPNTYNIESGKIDLPTLDNQNGYEFKGWCTVNALDNPGCGPITEFTPTQTDIDGLKLYAKWEFNCAGGKWMHVGSGENDKMCLNNTKPDGKALGVMVGNVPYYVRLSERGDNSKTINSKSNTKLHVQIGETVYNAHDASIE